MSTGDRIRLLTAALTDAVPESVVALRGSRAAGTADELSDIDLDWRVGTHGDGALEDLPGTLGGVGRPASLRLDPESALESERRLVFVRFEGWSVFERVDLEIVGRFGADVPSWAGPWSAAESALMNGIAAIKALRRGRGDVDGLLGRGAARIGVEDANGSVPERIAALVDAAEHAEPAQRALAARIRAELGHTR
ncbi:hypothetical protein [Curtobacterium sp. ZW137]|uniref:hypothetical protein n=1 Tax=Curtobacterium sp. ZW137 TaxID=2485104 RepID=UPI000F4C255E|nr:hypothetical protein [Curtobacterium sp. ZW137]ROP61003.1 hypothetical protein EDF55_3005 [Curtobacterium sp. ZW137]